MSGFDDDAIARRLKQVVKVAACTHSHAEEEEEEAADSLTRPLAASRGEEDPEERAFDEQSVIEN